MRRLIALCLAAGCATGEDAAGPVDRTAAETSPTGAGPGGAPPGRPPGPEDGPPGAAVPALCINELSPANRVSARDEGGRASDWIELHNPTDADVRLAGWSIGDQAEPAEASPLHPDLVVEAGGYLVLWADSSPELGPTHLGFSLSAGGEVVALFAPDGAGTVVSYGPISSDLAAARRTDCCFDPGGGCFGFTFAGTPGAPNQL